MEIARSDDPIGKRRQNAEKRIAQFKADLKALAFVGPREALKIHLALICGRLSTVRIRHRMDG
jgi:hypothetical protein